MKRKLNVQEGLKELEIFLILDKLKITHKPLNWRITKKSENTFKIRKKNIELTVKVEKESMTIKNVIIHPNYKEQDEVLYHMNMGWDYKD